MTQEYGDSQSRTEGDRRETISAGDFQFSLPGRTRGLLYTSTELPIDRPAATEGLIGPSHRPLGAEWGPLEEARTKPAAEPSTIYIQMPVAKPSSRDAVPAPAQCPTYAELSPEQKWIYLDWLSDVSHQTDIEYVSLYHYGLERRLVEAEFDPAFDEVLLLQESHADPSFLSISSLGLLAACALRKRPDRLADAYQSARRYLSAELRLQFVHRLGLDLTAGDLMELAWVIAGVNRKYIIMAPETFEFALSQLLAKRYGDARFPLAASYTVEAMPKRRQIVFANPSLPADVREQDLPRFLEYQPLLTEVKSLLSEAHNNVKLAVKERNKSEAEQGSSSEAELSRTEATRLPLTCPSCGAAFEMEPEREQKCPFCGRTVYPEEHLGEESKPIVEGEQAAGIESAKEQLEPQERIVEPDLQAEHRQLPEQFDAAEATSEQHETPEQIAAQMMAADVQEAQERFAPIEAGSDQDLRQERVARLEQRVKDAQEHRAEYEESIARAQLEGELGYNAKAWGSFNQAFMDVVVNPRSGLFRNAKLEMAMLLRRDGRHHVQAQVLSEVAYSDYCRSAQTSTHKAGRPVGRRSLLRAFIKRKRDGPDSGPESFFSPGIVTALQTVMTEAQIDVKALREIFVSVARQTQQSGEAQVRPEDAWMALEKALKHES